MFTVKTLNAISDVIYTHLNEGAYKVDADAANPDAVIVRSASMHETALGEDLVAIARAGAGYNNIPVDTCTEKGIVVFNTPGANANAVKELVLTGLLMATRDVLGGIEWAKTLDGQGNQVPALVEKGKGQFVGPELKGKTLAIMGLGAIGGLVANVATHLGMEIIGYDPFISVESAWSLSRAVKRANTEEELLEHADYLSIHIPLIANAGATVNAEMISKMKKGAVILNFSRGEVVDNDAVAQALKSGQLRKYVTDFPNEQLLNTEGVLCIPHLGASTPESEENCADMAAKQIADFLTTGAIINAVNMPRCELGRPTMHRVAIIHKNVPKMISQITAKVSDVGVNINNMVNTSRGDIAYTVLDMEAAATEEVKNNIANIDGVVRVRVIA